MTDEEMAMRLERAYWQAKDTARAREAAVLPYPTAQGDGQGRQPYAQPGAGGHRVLAEARRLLGVSPEAQAVVSAACDIYDIGGIACSRHAGVCIPDASWTSLHNAIRCYRASLRPPEPQPRYYSGPGGIIMDANERREVPIERLLAALNASDAAEREGKAMTNEQRAREWLEHNNGWAFENADPARLAALLDAVEREALERAAKLCDEHRKQCEKNAKDAKALSSPPHYLARVTAFEWVAGEIRALARHGLALGSGAEEEGK